jgi:hypothetical protein
MLITKKLIDFYLGYDYSSPDVIIVPIDDENTEIVGWNIAAKPQPTLEELEALQPQAEIQENNEFILSQIKDIQLNKLPRAFFEPTQKDENTTWLEFYTSQIVD